MLIAFQEYQEQMSKNITMIEKMKVPIRAYEQGLYRIPLDIDVENVKLRSEEYKQISESQVQLSLIGLKNTLSFSIGSPVFLFLADDADLLRLRTLLQP